MKKLHLLLLGVTLCFFSACHNDIWDAIDGLDSRVTKLEELCKEMNTNITSLQTIVSVLQSNDYITGIVEIKKNGEVIGYTITFGKHDPITIYHGQDGKDGQNGTDGKDGQDGSSSTPVIGVAQDTDGVYYWTLNGEWLLDDNGNKLPVSGKDGQDGTDGKDGQDGKDGKDGADGQNGKDGITPQLKIEEGYWYISYDNGATWTQLGKATGEDGKDGADGKDGQNGTNGKDGEDGESMFQSVTQDENYVYFTLADGTVIKIAKGNGQSNDEFIFTITYEPNGGEGIMEIDTFYYGHEIKIELCNFTKSGYSFEKWNTKIDGTGASYLPNEEILLNKNITLYAQWTDKYIYVDLGLSVKWATCNIGASKPEEFGNYYAWGETENKTIYNWNTYKWCMGDYTNITKYGENSNYGIIDYKRVLELDDDAAHINWGGNWRMPTAEEMEELRKECTWLWTSQNGIDGYKVMSKHNGNSIFLPSSGCIKESAFYQTNKYGYYWSSTVRHGVNPNPSYAYAISFYYSDRNEISYGYGLCQRYAGCSIRPVYP